MAILRIAILAALYVTVIALGSHCLEAASQAERTLWGVLAIVSAVSAIFDQSRLKWLPAATLTILAVFTVGFEIPDRSHYWIWFVTTVVVSCTLVTLFYLELKKEIRLAVCILAAVVAVLPSSLRSELLTEDMKIAIFYVAGTIFSLFPVFVSYCENTKPKNVFRLVGLQQFVLRAAFLLFCQTYVAHTDKGLYSSLGVWITASFVLMMLVLNIKNEKVSWRYAGGSAVSLFILYVTTTQSALIFDYCWAVTLFLAVAQTIPALKTEEGQLPYIRQALEDIALGSPAMILLLAAYKAAATIADLRELTIWALLSFLVFSGVWSQAFLSAPWGENAGSASKKWTVGRTSLLLGMYAFVIWSLR